MVTNAVLLAFCPLLLLFSSSLESAIKTDYFKGCVRFLSRSQTSFIVLLCFILSLLIYSSLEPWKLMAGSHEIPRSQVPGSGAREALALQVENNIV